MQPSQATGDTRAEDYNDPKFVLGPVGTINTNTLPQKISSLFTFFAHLSPGAAKDFLIEELDYYPSLFSEDIDEDYARDAVRSIELAINNFLPHGYAFESDSDTPMSKESSEYGIWGERAALVNHQGLSGTLNYIGQGRGSYYELKVPLEPVRDVAIVAVVAIADTPIGAVEDAASQLYDCGYRKHFKVRHEHEGPTLADLDMEVYANVIAKEPEPDERS